MKITKSIFASMIFVSCLFIVPVTFAGDEYILFDGTRALVEGKTMILFGANGKKSIAPPGRYDTRDGRYSIIVKQNEIIVRDHTKELR